MSPVAVLVPRTPQLLMNHTSHSSHSKTSISLTQSLFIKPILYPILFIPTKIKKSIKIKY
jgi:hypothetical protein